MKVKAIFIKSKNESDEKLTFDEFVKLSQKSSPTFLLEGFFEDYANDKIPEVEKRVDIPYKLIKDKIISKEDFLKEFSEYLNRSWEIASDVPYLVISLAKIFLFFQKNKICKFADIEVAKSDDYEDVIFFMKDFIEACYKLLKEEVSLKFSLF